MVHVVDGFPVAALRGIEPAAPHIPLRLEAVQADGLVVVVEGLHRVTEEEIARPAVEEGGRVFRLLADVAVEIAHGVLEALRQEIGHAPAEIQADESGPQGNGLLQVGEGLVVLAETAARDGAVVIAVGEDRIQADGGIEVLLRTPQVAQVVLGDPPVEEGPVVGRVQAGQDVETLDRLGVFPLGKRGPPPEGEYILVILRAADLHGSKKYPNKCERTLHKFPNMV